MVNNIVKPTGKVLMTKKRTKNDKPSALQIAKWFINYVDRDAGDDITHLKLQKLLYYAQAWYLANYSEPLFDEELQAWTHGPVVLSIWDEFKKYEYGSLPISDEVIDFSNEIEKHLQEVYKEYGKYSAKELERLTHEEEPWKKTRNNISIEEKCTNPIDKNLMRDYYAAKIKNT